MGPKTLPTIWGTYMKPVTKYQISAIISCWEKCDEKWAYMFNVYKNHQSRQTGSKESDGSKNTTHNMVYLYIRFLPLTVAEKNATKNILDGRTDRGKTAYPSSPFGERGINTCLLARSHSTILGYTKVAQAFIDKALVSLVIVDVLSICI